MLQRKASLFTDWSKTVKAVTAREMRNIDSAAIRDYGIPAVILMGYAGRAVRDVILESFGDAHDIALCCGSGNNGGDGFVIAWLLACAGRKVTVYFCGAPERLSPESFQYHTICLKSGISVISVDESRTESMDLSIHDLIVDALLGTGFAGPVRGVPERLIAVMNGSGSPIVAVDIPSGLPSDGPAPEWEVVRAHITVTMGLPKISMVTYPGKAFCGRIVVAEIGFPSELTDSPALKTRLIDYDFVAGIINPPVNTDINKTDRGHLLLVGGFDGMEGAVMMSAMAAFRLGAGLVTLLTTARARDIIAGKIPELMTLSLPVNDGGALSRDDVLALLTARSYDALVMGPGLGRSSMAAEFFTGIMEALPESGIGRVLIDGDGLYHLAAWIEGGRLCGNIDYVLTPHFMEASRILRRSVDDIKSDRLASAREGAAMTGATVLLKGPASIVCCGTDSFINTTGNPLLATGGTGDILSGIIGSLLLRDILAPEAAAAGCWIHGRAADILADSGMRNIMATDLLDVIPEAMKQ
jgi:NAD(P)H-hydrate epimerase